MSALSLYLLGFIALAAGVLIGAHLLGLAAEWLALLGVALVAVGLLDGAASLKPRNTSTNEEDRLTSYGRRG